MVRCHLPYSAQPSFAHLVCWLTRASASPSTRAGAILPTLDKVAPTGLVADVHLRITFLTCRRHPTDTRSSITDQPGESWDRPVRAGACAAYRRRRGYSPPWFGFGSSDGGPVFVVRCCCSLFTSSSSSSFCFRFLAVSAALPLPPPSLLPRFMSSLTFLQSNCWRGPTAHARVELLRSFHSR